MIICYGNPAKSLALAREKMNAEDFARFEREFEVFCVVQGLPGPLTKLDQQFLWAKWVFFQGRQYRAAQCINCGMDVDPKCACSSGRAASARIDDAYFEKIAIAMMSDEQREQSLERFGEFEDRWIAARVAQSYGKEKT